ncbi:ABC-three component system protein [Rhodococcus sp. 66b]|uniref:ABC-three component system protein n=1 Tax=Rhodococcus sp. 66b TaxID=1945511 RepID=UPI0009BBAF30|nr:ABC-three component system protein [Rhodococcus sp. 66b]OQM78051.1 hypothetical protein B0E55_06096 [Rhodococcus sp. 66b]
MEFYERLALRPVLWAHLHDYTGNSFENFFQDFMVLSFPGFVDVRTHGNLGDMSSDGLTLHDGRLYACYAPETPDAKATIQKFNKDFAGALEKRSGQFMIFVFVHNDVRGTHPEISVALANTKKIHQTLEFEMFGMRRLRDALGKMDRADVESLLKIPLPLQHDVAMGLPEMEELLSFLSTQRTSVLDSNLIEPVSAQKLRYSKLSEETQTELRDGMKYSSLIDNFYRERIDVTERDEVATRFHTEYLDAAQATPDAEEVLLRLRVFLAGSRMTTATSYRAQTAVLSYFFQTCDIFDNAPANWNEEIAKVMA